MVVLFRRNGMKVHNSSVPTGVCAIFSISVTVLLLTPFSGIAGPANVLIFFALVACIPFFSLVYNYSFSNKKDIIIVLPMILMLILILMSQIKGAFLDIPLSIQDYSDYFKFLMPMLLFLGACTIAMTTGEGYLSKPLMISSIVYALFFSAYLFFGPKIIYTLGLGRGEEHFYRYGGIDHNPNAYAAIGVGLLFYTIATTLTHRKIYFIFIPILLVLSVIMSQSRTALIALVVTGVIYILISGIKFWQKVMLAFVSAIVVFFAFSYFDLYWLMAPGRFDIETDASFGTRVNRSLEIIDVYGDHIGLLGIGPGREAFERIDTITYLMYLTRFGILGLVCFIIIHLWISIYFIYQSFIAKTRSEIRNANEHHILTVNIVFPIYVIISNISNEKWIDLKFLTIWFLLIALGVSTVRRYQYKTEGI